MGTTRIARGTGAPSTDFYTECDWVSQNQAGNYSTLYIWIKAVNRGSTGSYSNYQGSQTGSVDGVGSGSHSGTLPSGYANGQQRWYDGPWGYNVGHDANGYLSNLTVRQVISGWFNFNDTAVLPAPARIPKPASAPGTPSASEITSTSMRLSWGGSGDNGGSGITGYLLRRYDTSDGSGAYYDSFENNLSRVIGGLSRAKAYSWRVYARNNSAGVYSAPSGLLTASTMAEAPSAPGTPTASEVLPQSMRISWTASSDNGGATITSYKLRRYETSDGTGSYTDTDSNNLSRVISGLTPGKTYSWRVYAYNAYNANGYSPASGLLVIATMAPARLKVGGVYKYGIPYVKVSGVYKIGLPYVKRAGAYRQPS